jgi:MinD-like ATPase involved in chromosome partitioning or flagellar assembly
VLLVTLPELASLQDVSRFIPLTRSLAYPAGKVLTVLNRSGVLGGLRVKDIETALRHELFAEIPDDGPAALRSLNRGLPLVFRYPRSPASRALQRLAASLLRLAQVQPAKATAPAAGRLARAEKKLAPAAEARRA